MLSLTKGRSNKTGFLVLDDPGECFDAIRMDRFTKEIQEFGHDQTIIMTHQKDFAEARGRHLQLEYRQKASRGAWNR